MALTKRVFLFVLTNLLIVTTIGIVVRLLGLDVYIQRQGINYLGLAMICLLYGFGGAFISLGLSRIIAKRMMGVKVIDPQTNNQHERWLLERVYNMARMAGLTVMPEVGIYPSPEVNAFATGPTKNRALVAVSSGILQRMNEKELEGVLGHEISHIANGDMVTMTLLQGLINAFVMFLARIIAFAIVNATRSNDDEREGSGGGFAMQFIITMVLEIGLSLLGMFVVAFYSRRREFRADTGGAKLAGRESMIAALQKLQSLHELTDPRQNAISAFKISTKRSGGLLALMSTHPSLDLRIERLQRAV